VATGYRVTYYKYSEDIRELKLRDINPIKKTLKSNRWNIWKACLKTQIAATFQEYQMSGSRCQNG
jgi:hypothetical protein